MLFLKLELEVKKFLQKFGAQWKWETTYECSPKGMIWLPWLPTSVVVQVLHKSQQILHCLLEDKLTEERFSFSANYGLHTMEDRKNLWHGLAQLNVGIQEP